MTTTFRRRVLTSTDWLPATPAIALIDEPEPIPGIVRSSTGYEHSERRRQEAGALRELMTSEQMLVRQLLFESRGQPDLVNADLRDCRRLILAERLRLEDPRILGA